jgi:hypothetical protein
MDTSQILNEALMSLKYELIAARSVDRSWLLISSNNLVGVVTSASSTEICVSNPENESWRDVSSGAIAERTDLEMSSDPTVSDDLKQISISALQSLCIDIISPGCYFVSAFPAIPNAYCDSREFIWTTWWTSPLLFECSIRLAVSLAHSSTKSYPKTFQHLGAFPSSPYRR